MDTSPLIEGVRAMVYTNLTMIVVSFFMLLATAGVLIHSERKAGHQVTSAVELVNRILRSWDDFASVNTISGMPVGIEFTNANPSRVRPDQAVIVLKRGFQQEVRYKVVTAKHLARGTRGRWVEQGSYTFEEVELSAREGTTERES